MVAAQMSWTKSPEQKKPLTLTPCARTLTIAPRTQVLLTLTRPKVVSLEKMNKVIVFTPSDFAPDYTEGSDDEGNYENNPPFFAGTFAHGDPTTHPDGVVPALSHFEDV